MIVKFFKKKFDSLITINHVIYIYIYTFRISAHKGNDSVITDSLLKAEILKPQFKSVFTSHSVNKFLPLPGIQFPMIIPQHISENGVFMLLEENPLINIGHTTCHYGQSFSPMQNI